MIEHALIRNDTLVYRAAGYQWMFYRVLLVGHVYHHVMVHVRWSIYKLYRTQIQRKKWRRIPSLYHFRK
jgi:hypothetical protein